MTKCSPEWGGLSNALDKLLAPLELVLAVREAAVAVAALARALEVGAQHEGGLLGVAAAPLRAGLGQRQGQFAIGHRVGHHSRTQLAVVKATPLLRPGPLQLSIQRHSHSGHRVNVINLPHRFESSRPNSLLACPMLLAQLMHCTMIAFAGIMTSTVAAQLMAAQQMRDRECVRG